MPNVQSEPPKFLLPWINCDTFLTEKLKNKAGDARLQVLTHCWDEANEWDMKSLSIPKDPLIRREILMWAWDDICWYARTLIPSSTYHANPLLFDRLQNESLGNLIFHTTKIHRLHRVVYPIHKTSFEYSWLTERMRADADVLWVRRTTFGVQDSAPAETMNEIPYSFSFFLVEIFLPGLSRYFD